MRAAVVVLLAALTTAFAPQQTFRTSVDLVHFSVIVTDKQGAPVTGLTAEDFELVEDGKPQSLTYFLEGFSESGDLGRVLPLHLGLALDTSGSMEDDIHDVRTGMIKFVNANEHAVDTTLVDFDTEVRLARYAGIDYPRLIERIRMRKPDGWTAFYDAVGVYLNGAAEQDGEKILLIYTDGGDTRSSMTYTELINLLKASDVTTYVIGYLEHQPQSAKNGAADAAAADGGADRRGRVLPEQRQRAREDLREDRTDDRGALHAWLSLDRHPHERRLAQGADPCEAERSQGGQGPDPRRLLRSVQGRARAADRPVSVAAQRLAESAVFLHDRLVPPSRGARVIVVR